MGKATERSEEIRSRPLTPDEIRARHNAAELRDQDTVATLDGTFEKVQPGQSARVIQRAPEDTWD